MSTTADIPQYRYTPELAQQIEVSWQDRWEREGTFHAANPTGSLSDGFAEHSGEPKLFIMDMFPYPSGAGMHVGNTLGFIGTDVYSRYQRMLGRHVLHTMGFDAFGLPAEQYAVETGQHPRITTEENIATYRRQLRRIGMDHDTRRSIETIDPGYYRWTQWIFLQIFNSWYDTDADRARPIDELIEELDAGTRAPQPGANPFGREWTELSTEERNQVVDNHRLAVSHRALVNWCPGLGTVLSNEEVTADGRSERGNFPVFRRPLKQWMMRITAYAERLLNDLDTIEWPDSIKLQQSNWIGRSIGAHVSFGTDIDASIDVFTTRPDTLFGATYMVLAPEHPLVDQLVPQAWPQDIPQVWTGGANTPAQAVAAYRSAASRRSDRERESESREKTGVFTGAYAINPVNNSRIPVFIADYVLMGYGTGAIMAVPAQDQRDWDFATVFSLPIIRTVQPPEGFDGEAYVGAGPAINSQFLDGLEIAPAKERIVSWLEERGSGRGAVTFRLRDWLFSRQRYWGEPFPIVYDENDRPHAVPDSLLPVSLPDVDDYSPKTFALDDEDSEPEAPLSRAKEWVEVELDLGDGPKTYRRDTNTMPNWAGSCWYHLRYIDPDNAQALIDPESERYWMGADGVDLYVGGAEHAVLHLLYARFWHKVLFDLGHVTTPEPFHKLVNQGMLQLPAYTDSRGFYVAAKEVEDRDGEFFFHGEPVRQEIGKIGKSLKNVVTPDDIVAEWGADTFRLYEMFTGPLDQSRPWGPKAISGMLRLLQRIWRVIIDEEAGAVRVADIPVPDETARILHRTIAAVREGNEALRFNTSIARITELSNHLTQAYAKTDVPVAVAEPLVLLLAPLAPHIAEELWSRLGHSDSLAEAAFPEADPALLVEETVEIPVQVNGKVRATVQIGADADKDAMESAARSGVSAQLEGKTVRKVIVVPGRLVNFVVS